MILVETNLLLYAKFADCPQHPKEKTCFDIRATCNYDVCMSKMIQIRNVPDRLHRRLKARAAMDGRTLSDFLLEEIRKSADRPSMSDLRARLQARETVQTDVSPAKAVREERER